MVWRAKTSTLNRGDSWVLISFVRGMQTEAIYYYHDQPHLTHVGIVARRKGDLRLIEVAEAAIAYEQLTGSINGFEVNSI